jgi:hypothetical protein
LSLLAGKLAGDFAFDDGSVSHSHRISAARQEAAE